MARIVVGISGASGIILAHRATCGITEMGHEVELIMTKDAQLTAVEEMGAEWSTPEKFVQLLPKKQQSLVRIHAPGDFSAPIASGSFPTSGMLIIPCSMATVAAVATGLSDNLLRRAADVTIKERRRLVIVPREAPFSEIHLENMLKLSRMGVVVVPPVPGWYVKPKTVEEMEAFIVGRILDQLGIETGYSRWKS